MRRILKRGARAHPQRDHVALDLGQALIGRIITFSSERSASELLVAVNRGVRERVRMPFMVVLAHVPLVPSDGNGFSATAGRKLTSLPEASVSEPRRLLHHCRADSTVATSRTVGLSRVGRPYYRSSSSQPDLLAHSPYRVTRGIHFRYPPRPTFNSSVTPETCAASTT